MDIYLDNQATTATDPRVVDTMLPFFSEHFGNPHSSQHEFGRTAADAVAQARREVASLIGAQAAEVVFTSGATEANNQAILGAARANTSTRRHLVTTAIEHPCISACMDQLASEGYQIDLCPVDSRGRLDMAALEKLVTESTLLVSVMAANNEIGVIQDLAAIGQICRTTGAMFHTDAAQAAAKLNIDVERLNIDLLGISGHKLYGPMGSGALYIRNRPNIKIAPLLIGGGQEFGLRSGTVAAPLVVGLGKACALGAAEMVDEATRLTGMRDTLFKRLTANLPDLVLNGHPEHRLPGNLSVRVPEIRAVDVIDNLDGVALSSASACATGGDTPSHVLEAIGLTPEQAECCLRIGIGRFNTEQELEQAATLLTNAFHSARAMR